MKRYLMPHLAVATFAAGAAYPADLTVTVTDIRSQKGSIRVGLFNSESAWKDPYQPLAAQATAPAGSEVTLQFTGLPAGTYAVQVLHDENDNSKLDTNLLGIPIEHFGFSGNSNANRRANFDEAQFKVGAENTTIVVRLR